MFTRHQQSPHTYQASCPNLSTCTGSEDQQDQQDQEDQQDQQDQDSSSGYNRLDHNLSGPSF